MLDEPWSGLDADARPVLTAVVEQLVAAGTAVVLTDHTHTAEALACRRTMLLHDGGLRDTASSNTAGNNAGRNEASGNEPGSRASGSGTSGRAGASEASGGVRTVRVVVTLRCADPGQAAQRMAGFGAVEWQDGGIAVRIPARDTDALLLTALRMGCSVREVRECPN